MSGIITTDDKTFIAMVHSKSPAMSALSLGCRSLIFDVLPGTIEVVWPHQGNAGYGTGPRKMTDQFCWIAPASKHISLGFYYGAELPDPAGLLEGTGQRMRHVKLREIVDLSRPALRDLIQAATTHGVPPLPH